MSDPAETPRDPKAVNSALCWLLRDALGEHGNLIESLGRSISEAAYQGSDPVLAVHVRQTRLVVIDAIAAIKKLQALTGGAP